jgi:hypothetical protein
MSGRGMVVRSRTVTMVRGRSALRPWCHRDGDRRCHHNVFLRDGEA